MRINISTGAAKNKPQSGDEKTVNGVTYIRQQEFSKLHGAYVVSNGRPVYEWVEKGSERDRMARYRNNP